MIFPVPGIAAYTAHHRCITTRNLCFYLIDSLILMNANSISIIYNEGEITCSGEKSEEKYLHYL